MVPEGPRLLRLEYVSETCPRSYWTLGDHVGSVHPGSVDLGDAVPMDGGGFRVEHVDYVHYHGLSFVDDQRWPQQPAVDPDKRAIGETVGGVGLSAVGVVAASRIRAERNVLQFSEIVDDVRFSRGARGCVADVAGKRDESLDDKLEVTDVVSLWARAGRHVVVAILIAGLARSSTN